MIVETSFTANTGPPSAVSAERRARLFRRPPPPSCARSGRQNSQVRRIRPASSPRSKARAGSESRLPSGDRRDRFVGRDHSGPELIAVVGAEAWIRLDHRHERAVAVPLFSDEAAGARRAPIVLRLIVAPAPRAQRLRTSRTSAKLRNQTVFVTNPTAGGPIYCSSFRGEQDCGRPCRSLWV